MFLVMNQDGPIFATPDKEVAEKAVSALNRAALHVDARRRNRHSLYLEARLRIMLAPGGADLKETEISRQALEWSSRKNDELLPPEQEIVWVQTSPNQFTTHVPEPTHEHTLIEVTTISNVSDCFKPENAARLRGLKPAPPEVQYRLRPKVI